MTSAPLIEAIRARLVSADYESLATPLEIAGVPFPFSAAMRGKRGRALDLILIVDTTAGDFDESDPRRVRHRFQALSRALDITQSRYVVTAILAGAAVAADMEALAETCRVLHIASLPKDANGETDVDRLDDRIRVLLPLSIPTGLPQADVMTPWQQLENAVPEAVDSNIFEAIFTASEGGEEAVTSAIAKLIDDALVQADVGGQ